MRRRHVTFLAGISCLLLVMGMLIGCGIVEETIKEMDMETGTETEGNTEQPASQCTFSCPSGTVLVAETTLNRCNVYVVNADCVGTATPARARETRRVILSKFKTRVMPWSNSCMTRCKTRSGIRLVKRERSSQVEVRNGGSLQPTVPGCDLCARDPN